MAASKLIKTGIQVEEKSFTWKIENFAEVRTLDKFINAQRFTFYAGETIGLSSKWEVWLNFNEQVNPAWIGVYLGVVEKPTTKPKHLFGRVTFQLLKQDESVHRQSNGVLYDWGAYEPGLGWGLCNMIKKSGSEPLVDGHLVLRVILRLFSDQTSAKEEASVEEMLAKFHERSTKKVRRDLATLPVNFNGIEIVSSDGKQFQATKEVLIASSPVFETMLRSDMREKSENRIELKDISSQTVHVLLHYFYTGELLPQWKEQHILPELTNAAAEYDLKELLGFLDCVLGKVCIPENVIYLLTLADKLDLKTSEEDLLNYVRTEGVASKTTIYRMLKPDLPADSDQD